MRVMVVTWLVHVGLSVSAWQKRYISEKLWKLRVLRLLKSGPSVKIRLVLGILRIFWSKSGIKNAYDINVLHFMSKELVRRRSNLNHFIQLLPTCSFRLHVILLIKFCWNGRTEQILSYGSISSSSFWRSGLLDSIYPSTCIFVNHKLF